MSYKPDEATLVAYHYGELEGEEQLKVEGYLQEHPAERNRVEEWQQTRSVLASLQDKEVISPPLVLGDNYSSIWNERYFRMTIGIAASFLVVLVAARLLGLSASVGGGEFRIGFGTPANREVPVAGIGEGKVEQMIQASLHENNTALQATWNNDRRQLEESIQKNLDKSSNKIDLLVKKASTSQEEQVRQFVGQLQNDNLKLMRDYMQLSTAGQKAYIEGLLVDFSDYVQEQRKQDIQYFQSSITNMQQNTNQFKKDTEQILTSLMTNSRPDNLRRN